MVVGDVAGIDARVRSALDWWTETGIVFPRADTRFKVVRRGH
jgi:hypothetical protein